MLEPCMVDVETLEQHQKTGRLRLFAAKMGSRARWPGGSQHIAVQYFQLGNQVVPCLPHNSTYLLLILLSCSLCTYTCTWKCPFEHWQCISGTLLVNFVKMYKLINIYTQYTALSPLQQWHFVACKLCMRQYMKTLSTSTVQVKEAPCW